MIASADPGVLYVSNVNGEGGDKDGDGFIARVSRDGRTIERDWARGLDAPKGMALANGALYVADIDQIVEIDPASGAVRARHAAPGAHFLNDVAALADGSILAADSDTQRIYRLHGGGVEVWLENELLRAVNGLLPQRSALIVTTMAGRLLSIDLHSRQITVVAQNLGDADGVARLGDGYLVSEWPGVLHYVNGRGEAATLSDTRAANIYQNDILLLGDTLLVPNWRPGTLSAYRVER